MNIVFSTQTTGLKIFYYIYHKIKEPLNISKSGFYVSHSMHYDSFVQEHAGFENAHSILKEWEIVSSARKSNPNSKKILAFEKKYGQPSLWDAIVSDRRVYLGKYCKQTQSYTPAFGHNHMLSLIEVGIDRIETFIDSIRPDVILSLDPVTFGDYLFYLIARKRNIPMLFFRTTKIKNYVRFEDVMFGCSPILKESYDSYRKHLVDDQWVIAAKKYLSEILQSDIKYEGMINIPSKTPENKQRNSPLGSVVRLIGSEMRYQFKYRGDHHNPGVLIPSIYSKIITPIKARVAGRLYAKSYLNSNALTSFPYAFFPLQSEPEIAGLIWGKPYMNQIESARQIARSLPMGFKLVVKEHPRALGYRSLGYYKKLLNIPNVVLLHPDQEVRSIIKGAAIVISIAGFVGFEAVLYKKPSIMLGGPRPFSILPDTMIRYVDNLNRLAWEVKDMLDRYKYNETELLSYIASTMRHSVPIDYFTSLLNKKKRHGDSGEDRFAAEIKKMADHAIKRIEEVLI